MIRHPIPHWLFITLSIVGVCAAALVYEGLSIRQTHINPTQTILPGPRALWNGVEMITRGQGTPERPMPSWLWIDFRTTYWRLFLGMVVGVCMSVIMGIAMGAYSPVEALFNPLITFFAKIPSTAMMALYMIVFGVGLEAYIAMVALGIFFSMAQAVYQTVKKDVTPEQIDKAYTLGASDAEILVEVIWRQILPRVIENIRLQVGPAMVFLIAAEMVFAGSEGIGYRIRIQSRLANMNVVYLYLAFLGASGLIIDFMLVKLRRYLCPWFGE